MVRCLCVERISRMRFKIFYCSCLQLIEYRIPRAFSGKSSGIGARRPAERLAHDVEFAGLAEQRSREIRRRCLSSDGSARGAISLSRLEGERLLARNPQFVVKAWPSVPPRSVVFGISNRDLVIKNIVPGTFLSMACTGDAT